MSNQIERLRYYDGEYLRGSDFSDEQAYHVEMRRRLNHRLHLHGIVYGLQLQPDQDSPPSPAFPFFSIEPGMALDQSGREIFVPAPYSLSAESILNRAGLTKGPNELWLCYQETPTGLPAAGYRDCNAKDQYTRWQELFQVVLKPLHPIKTSIVTPDCGGVRLGILTLDYSSADGWQITDAKNVGRSYVGIRAQRLIAADEEAETFDMAKQNILLPKRIALPGYIDVKPSVLERGNLIVEKNVVVGDDFVLNDPALPNPIPDSGNLKITHDLFLNGDFYGEVGGKWFLLKDYIQTLMPSTVVGGPITVPLAPTLASPEAGSFPVPGGVQSLIVTSKAPKVMLSINGILWQSEKFLHAKWGSIAADISLGITAQITQSLANKQSYDMSITWTATPAITGPVLPIKSIEVGYVVVFLP